jgi:hypothetical protein
LASSAYHELLRRRERLLMRSNLLRQDWSLQVQVLRAPLGLADQARAATAWLVQNPLWPLGALALVAVLRPGRVLRWGGLAWQGWAAYRRVQRIMGGTRQAPR